MKQWTDKRRERNDEAKVIRQAMVDNADGCEICGCSPARPNRSRLLQLSQLCVHEIANGPCRKKAQDKAYATLVVCWSCNGDLNDKSEYAWPETRQLAVLALSRPQDFDLRAYNELVNPRAPRRITLFEVFEEMVEAKERIESNRLFTPDEVAHIMNVNRKTVRRWIDAQQLRAIDVAPPGATKRHFRIEPADLRAFAQSRESMSEGDFEQLLGEVQENWR
jgi:excisionase family DNA binding protein